jgi:hypothetical protein
MKAMVGLVVPGVGWTPATFLPSEEDGAFCRPTEMCAGALRRR